MRRRRWEYKRNGLAVLAAVCCACQSQAQGATPKAAPGFVLPPLAGTDLASLSVEVKGFKFEGHSVFTTETLQALVADAVGQRLDPSALDELRNRINRLYVEAGYLNSGAVLSEAPGGAATQGMVVIRIIEGRVDAVHVRGLNRLDPRYVRSRLVREGEPLNINRLQERFRLLLADPLFEKINSRIVPGDEPGSAVLSVDVVRANPYALEVFVNNYRPPSVGSTAIGLRGVVRNLTGQGDALDVTVQHTQGGDPVHVGWSVVPQGSETRAFVSYERSVAAVVEESLAAIDIKSRSSGVEAGVGRTLVDTLARHVEVALSHVVRKSSCTLLGMPFSFTPGDVDGVSEIRAWRFSQEWTERWDQQAITVRSVLVSGTNNADSASVQTADPASVPRRRYGVWSGQAQYVHSSVGARGELRLRGNAQYSPERLVPLEQFAVGGNATVRGYRENAVLRDRAAIVCHRPLRGGADSHRSLR